MYAATDWHSSPTTIALIDRHAQARGHRRYLIASATATNLPQTSVVVVASRLHARLQPHGNFRACLVRYSVRYAAASLSRCAYGTPTNSRT